MKNFLLFLVLLLPAARGADTPGSRSGVVILDETGVKNLRIQTAEVEEAPFEETVFALGRIAVLPGHRAVISSRIPGRATEVLVKPDHPITQGDVAVVVESRQPGNPPPSIRITSPLTGLVSRTAVVPGEPVEPDRVLAEVVDLDAVYAIARVPENLAGRLRPGQDATISVPAVGNRSYQARLEHLGAEADSDQGTIEAAFRLDNSDHALRPGMRAEFSIVVEKSGSVVSIPRSALQGDTAGRFVWVKDFELPHAFIKTPVQVGRSSDRMVEILGGLFPADEVVTQGAYSLAFAGGGSVSLKEALDAAHGHEHAEDGSELTEADRATRPDEHPENAGKKHHPFWMAVSGVLFFLLIILSLRGKGASRAE